jgi:hypothetical protein
LTDASGWLIHVVKLCAAQTATSPSRDRSGDLRSTGHSN